MSCFLEDKRIFISYRRKDSLGYAAGLEYGLETEYKAENVFRDVADIGGGADYAKVIQKEVNRCHLAIVLISPSWTSVTGSDGTRRLHDPNDLVRREVELALRRTNPIIPVLIEDAQMPTAGELPESIHGLIQRNGMPLRDRFWRSDLEAILDRVAASLIPKKFKLAGSSIYDHVRGGVRAPKWVGRAGGRDHPNLASDIASGEWRELKYEIQMDGPMPSQNWFLATEFADRIDASGADESMQSGASSGSAPATVTEADLERGAEVARELKGLGVKGILITAAQQGLLTRVACQIPECLCPEELGGATYFEPKVAGALTDWMPTADHYPTLKAHGGQLTVDNVRLAHRLCNRVDYAKQSGRPYARDLARIEAARERGPRASSDS